MDTSRLHGITITLYDKTSTTTDDFGVPVYTETAVSVDNVIVGQPTSQEILDTLNLTGKKAVYTLGIPKGDTHTWTDRKVSFFGQTFKTISMPIGGIEDMIPLDWNYKIMVEAYE